ncbi:GIN domain-containing protein [Hirschia litorea]|uniref:GIN domain-containing protein n=1 Tax=Hirschia litorea TaxID=1199156 RepID=A0ABW2ILN4_9PROT
MPKYFAPLFLSTACFALVAACSASADSDLKIKDDIQVADAQGVADGLVDIQDFVGVLTVRTSSDGKYDAKLQQGALVEAGKIDAIKVDLASNGVRVTGDDDLKISQCKSSNGKYRLKLKGDKLRSIDEFPHLEITMPTNSNLDLELKSGVARIGDLHSTSVIVNGCGDVFLQDVSGFADFQVNGSGDISAENIGELSAEVRGSGDVKAENISGKAVLAIKGSGDISLENIAGHLFASIMGSGDIYSKSAQEKALVDIRGSGDVTVDGGQFQSVGVSVSGSGDVLIDGKIEDLNISIKGSGDVETGPLSGSLSGGISGSGDLVIDGRHIAYEKGQWQR